jgi:hypothetical protein
MLGSNLNLKQIAVISDNSVIFTTLSDNSAYNIQLVDKGSCRSFFDSIKKLDLLIIDTELEFDAVAPYRVNAFINLTGKKLFANEMNFFKPFKLEKLLDIISGVMNDEHIFCCINNHWIYNQFLAKIASADLEIALTNRENDLFATLLQSKNFATTKDFLKSEIWNYHQDSETTTVDIHLYKLKNKLPEGMLEIKSAECFLNITSLS